MRDFMTAAELLAVQKAEAPKRQRELRERKYAPIEYADKVFIVVSRCTQGPPGWLGMFQVSQLSVEENGRPLKRPTRKVIAEGVDMVVAMSSIETALRRRIYK